MAECGDDSDSELYIRHLLAKSSKMTKNCENTEIWWTAFGFFSIKYDDKGIDTLYLERSHIAQLTVFSAAVGIARAGECLSIMKNLLKEELQLEIVKEIKKQAEELERKLENVSLKMMVVRTQEY